jgi:DNA-binding transcriptional regulator YhcF (GntR family)
MAGRRRLEADLRARPALALRSDRLLAQDYGITYLTVNRARRKLEADCSIPMTEWRICRNGNVQDLPRQRKDRTYSRNAPQSRSDGRCCVPDTPEDVR